MYKLTISAQTKSRARLIDKRLKVKNFIVGQEYDVNFVVKNIGDEPSPPGRFTYDIKWPGTTAGTTSTFNVKSLESGKCNKSKTRKYLALSTGLATIKAQARTNTPENESINIWSKDGKSLLNRAEAFETFYATTPEAIYEYWAFIVGAASLFILAIKEMWLALQFLISVPC